MANPDKKLVTQFTVLVRRASLEKENNTRSEICSTVSTHVHLPSLNRKLSDVHHPRYHNAVF